MEFTGERYLSWVDDAIISYEHLHRYRFAKEFVRDKKVLDLACGEGYGSFMLSDEAESVTGIDIDEVAIRHAASKYLRENLKFIKGSIIEIPIEGEKIFDVIVCFEALEHIKDHDKLMKEVKRLLKFDGVFIVSTPNIYIYSDQPNYQNPFHLKELYFDEFKDLLSNNFKNIFLYGQKVYPSSNIFPIYKGSGASKDFVIKKGDKEFHFLPIEKKMARYLIAIASDSNLDRSKLLGNSYLLDISETLFRQKDTYIFHLNGVVREKEGQITALDAAVKEKDAHISYLEDVVREKDTHIQNLNATIREIEGSLGWQILNKFRVWRDKFLKPNTIRRYIYDLAIKAIKYTQREGINGLLRKISERYTLPIPVSYFLEVVNTNMLPFQTHTVLSLEGGIQGSFYCPLPNLSEVQILTATNTYKRINSDLELCIKTGSVNGSMIRRSKIKGKQIIDNGYTCFRFKPIKDSREKTFFFELKSIGNPSAVVWYNSGVDFPELKLYKDGKTISGSINFKALVKHKVRNNYELWILKNEPTEVELRKQKHLSKEFTYTPKISIITPVYNISEGILIKTIESVVNQTYNNWELCLVDGNSSKSHVKRILNSYASKDSRIKVKFLSENKGIAGNSNEALSLATGEFIGFLDHDDELSPDALYEIIKSLNENPDLDFIYTDEDKITLKGERVDPHFKPEWSPDTLRSYNYINHFAVIRKKVIDEVGGFREGYEGSQDYDLFLRVIERTQRIARIPKVLYHWRAYKSSAAGSRTAKMYAYESAKKALRDHIQRIGLNGDVYDGLLLSSYRIKYHIKGSPMVSIVITTKDKVDILKKCIDSIIHRSSYRNYEILIVDNQSMEDETLRYYNSLKDEHKIKVLSYDKPFNFSAINNYAVSQIDSEYILFLNNDIEVISPDWIESMLEFAQRRDVGVVGALLYYPNKEVIQHAGVIIGLGGVAGHSHRYFPKNSFGYIGRAKIIQNLSAVTGACLMTKKEVFYEVGGFDENYSHAFNDIDLCLKIRGKGYLIIYTPYAELYHHESLSRGYEDTPEKQARFKKEIEYFQRKWKDVLANGDPYYNPNLTLDREDFSIKI